VRVRGRNGSCGDVAGGERGWGAGGGEGSTGATIGASGRLQTAVAKLIICSLSSEKYGAEGRRDKNEKAFSFSFSFFVCGEERA
jgi:hypothetical protein